MFLIKMHMHFEMAFILKNDFRLDSNLFNNCSSVQCCKWISLQSNWSKRDGNRSLGKPSALKLDEKRHANACKRNKSLWVEPDKMTGSKQANDAI